MGVLEVREQLVVPGWRVAGTSDLLAGGLDVDDGDAVGERLDEQPQPQLAARVGGLADRALSADLAGALNQDRLGSWWVTLSVSA